MVAKKFTVAPKRVSFAVSDAVEFKRELVDFGLGSETTRPLICARDAAQRRYTFTGEFSLESLESFVDDLLAGVLTPHIRTEPAPPLAEDNGPVKTVIGTSFGEIVNDPTKDVLLMLRAPACNRCSAVVQSWKKVAEKLENDTDIVFAQIDAVANELPTQYYLKGYPTIFFVPQNLKTYPKFYEGEHETKEFIKFLARESSTPLKNYERNGKRKTVKPAKTEL